MSNKQPDYMQTEWFNGLKKEIAATSVTAVAARLDISRTTLSVFVNGKGLYGTGGAKPDAIELRYRRVFEQLVCTHTGALVGVQHCREIALRPAPTHNPLQMVQWQSCQQCSYKPRPVPVAAPIQPAAAKSTAGQRMTKQNETEQQAGIIDKVTLPLPEVGAPQIATENQPVAAGAV